MQCHVLLSAYTCLHVCVDMCAGCYHSTALCGLELYFYHVYMGSVNLQRLKENHYCSPKSAQLSSLLKQASPGRLSTVLDEMLSISVGHSL